MALQKILSHEGCKIVGNIKIKKNECKLTIWFLRLLKSDSANLKWINKVLLEETRKLKS